MQSHCRSCGATSRQRARHWHRCCIRERAQRNEGAIDLDVEIIHVDRRMWTIRVVGCHRVSANPDACTQPPVITKWKLPIDEENSHTNDSGMTGGVGGSYDDGVYDENNLRVGEGEGVLRFPLLFTRSTMRIYEQNDLRENVPQITSPSR